MWRNLIKIDSVLSTNQNMPLCLKLLNVTRNTIFYWLFVVVYVRTSLLKKRKLLQLNIADSKDWSIKTTTSLLSQNLQIFYFPHAVELLRNSYNLGSSYLANKSFYLTIRATNGVFFIHAICSNKCLTKLITKKWKFCPLYSRVRWYTVHIRYYTLKPKLV